MVPNITWANSGSEPKALANAIQRQEFMRWGSDNTETWYSDAVNRLWSGLWNGDPMQEEDRYLKSAPRGWKVPRNGGNDAVATTDEDSPSYGLKGTPYSETNLTGIINNQLDPQVPTSKGYVWKNIGSYPVAGFIFGRDMRHRVVNRFYWTVSPRSTKKTRGVKIGNGNVSFAEEYGQGDAFFVRCVKVRSGDLGL